MLLKNMPGPVRFAVSTVLFVFFTYGIVLSYTLFAIPGEKVTTWIIFLRAILSAVVALCAYLGLGVILHVLFFRDPDPRPIEHGDYY